VWLSLALLGWWLVVVVCFVSLCVFVYSWFYLSSLCNFRGFSLVLVVFVFRMVLLVVSDSLLSLFVG